LYGWGWLYGWLVTQLIGLVVLVAGHTFDWAIRMDWAGSAEG